MYNTKLLSRIGVFQINDSCKSMDVSQDSKYLLATATTKGVLVFDVSNGDKLAEIQVPGIMTHKVEFSYSNKQFAVVFED